MFERGLAGAGGTHGNEIVESPIFRIWCFTTSNTNKSLEDEQEISADEFNSERYQMLSVISDDYFKVSQLGSVSFQYLTDGDRDHWCDDKNLQYK